MTTYRHSLREDLKTNSDDEDKDLPPLVDRAPDVDSDDSDDEDEDGYVRTKSRSRNLIGKPCAHASDGYQKT